MIKQTIGPICAIALLTNSTLGFAASQRLATNTSWQPNQSELLRGANLSNLPNFPKAIGLPPNFSSEALSSRAPSLQQRQLPLLRGNTSLPQLTVTAETMATLQEKFQTLAYASEQAEWHEWSLEDANDNQSSNDTIVPAPAAEAPWYAQSYFYGPVAAVLGVALCCFCTSRLVRHLLVNYDDDVGFKRNLRILVSAKAAAVRAAELAQEAAELAERKFSKEFERSALTPPKDGAPRPRSRSDAGLYW